MKQIGHQKIFNTLKINESGRSMIEMLTVIAIIGVLSVGGILGYTSAITIHRANTIAEDSQKHAVDLSAELGLGHEISTNTVIQTPSGYHIGLFDLQQNPDGVLHPSAPYFGLTIGETGNFVSREVARNLLDKAIGAWREVWGFAIKKDSDFILIDSDESLMNELGEDLATSVLLIYRTDLTHRDGNLMTNI